MICLKIRTFVVSATTHFAVSIVYCCCDLLENSYLCGISNNPNAVDWYTEDVVICLKIRTFVVSATTHCAGSSFIILLWFAWKFVPLWYQQQLVVTESDVSWRCDLLENSYLCGISNNELSLWILMCRVVICLKIRTFVVSATTHIHCTVKLSCCDLLENSYLCGISNNFGQDTIDAMFVVICLKIRTFVVSATTRSQNLSQRYTLWFAWKFVPLWYQQQR